MSSSCETCGETFMTDEEGRQHLSTKQHIKNLKRYGSEETKIFVTGILPDTQNEQLRKYFSQYGDVQNVVKKKETTYAFVNFKRKSDVTHVLQFVHIFEGRTLSVKQFSNVKKYNITGGAFNRQELISELQQCSTVSEQVNLFLQKLRLTRRDIDLRNRVYNDVWASIQNYYPEGTIYVYGSTVNGFGIKGCDLDLLFEPSPTYWDCVPPEDRKKKKKNEVDAIFSVNDVQKGIVPYERRINQPSNIHVQFLREVLATQPIFLRPHYIPARCPIVRFTHKATHQQCDFSCSTKLVVYNTKLLEFYSKLDPRIPPLMMILRYWAKFVGLIGLRNMSSYAFSLLVIFFLQNTKPSVLPSVNYLRSKADVQVIIGGWDCSFCTERDRIEPSANTKTVEQLILEFFQYYIDFDFAYVVSPLSGSPLPRSYFSGFNNKEDQNFESCPICVQDPFEFTRNVTAFLNIKVLLKLKETLRNVAPVYKAKVKAAKPSPFWGILSLFHGTGTKIIEQPLSLAPIATIRPSSEVCSEFTFIFSRERKDCITNQRSSRMCLDKIFSTILDIFRYSLNFETEVIDMYDVLPMPKRGTKRSASDETIPSNKVHCGNNRQLNLEVETLDCDNSYVSSGKHALSEESHKEQCDNELEPGELIDDDDDEPVSTSQTFDVTHSVKDENEPVSPSVEIPDYITHQMLISVQNIVSYDVWTERKKFRGNIFHKQQAVGKRLELEHDVSERIMNERAPLLEEMQFTCDCYTYRENGCDELHFVLTPFNCHENFKPLPSLLKILIMNLLNDVLW